MRHAACWFLVLAACAEPPAVEADIEAVYEPAALDGDAPFFDFPYPSDLRTDELGRPRLDSLTNRGGLLRSAIDVIESGRPGFSNQSAIYFRFTGALDPASLPSDPNACTAEASSVAIVDVDPSSPERGQRLPCFTRFRAEPSQFWAENALVLRAVPGIPMHPGRRYAAVVLDSIRGEGGARVVSSPRFAELPRDELWGELERAGIARDRIVVATSFTTSDPAVELDHAREFVLSMPLPAMRDHVMRREDGVLVFEATFDTYELFSDEAPYATFGEGRFRFDDAGMPLDVHARPVHVAITVPDTAPPAEGFPLVLYGHGTGGDRLTHVSDEGAALAREGIAMLGLDAPFHGMRSIGIDPSLLPVANTVVAVEMIRQTVLDLALLFRMQREGALDVPAGVGPVRFARAPLLYMGHSQGAQVAGVLLGIEPDIDAAFLSEGGGDALITVVEIGSGTSMSTACVIGALAGEDCSEMTEDHPLLNALVRPLVDAGDPLAYAHRMIRERPSDWTPLSIAMTEGLSDQYTPARTIEALAGAIGLPRVEPVLSETDVYRVLGIESVAPPISGNLRTPDGAPITGGLMQWEGDHFVIYRIPDAQRRYVEFLREAARGAPIIVAP